LRIVRYRDEWMTGVDTGPNDEGSDSHFTCPFCTSHQVDRLYLAPLRLDSCRCLSCGARWDEDPGTGEFRGRGARSSILAPRSQRR
jgi:hypothetical protein